MAADSPSWRLAPETSARNRSRRLFRNCHLFRMSFIYTCSRRKNTSNCREHKSSLGWYYVVDCEMKYPYLGSPPAGTALEEESGAKSSRNPGNPVDSSAATVRWAHLFAIMSQLTCTSVIRIPFFFRSSFQRRSSSERRERNRHKESRKSCWRSRHSWVSAFIYVIILCYWWDRSLFEGCSNKIATFNLEWKLYNVIYCVLNYISERKYRVSRK